MKYRILLAFSFILLSQLAWSQLSSVSGVVYDENGVPLPMVTIVIVGTTNGTIADIEGNFSIEANLNDVISFTYVGYATQEVTVAGQTGMEVIMIPEINKLEDVIVIGYGTKRREDIMGAVASVSGTDLRKTGVNNISHLIQDAVPGIHTSIQSGQPGADDARITIRGASTWNGDNAPLILVDGIEASGGFSQINVGEIASVSVLKDAASTSIYGVRGANGVILLTTRRGNIGRPSITATVGITAKAVSDLPDQLSSYDVLTLGQESIKNTGKYEGLRPQWFVDRFSDPNRNIYAYPDVDWYKELMKSVGWENNARISISGGTKFVRYFTSISRDNVGDVINNDAIDGYYDPQFSFEKLNFRSNLDFNPTKTTKFNVDIAGRSEFRKTPDVDVNPRDFANVFKYINEATPYLFPVFYPAEFVREHPDPLDPNASSKFRLSGANSENPYQFNPYNSINYSGMRKSRKDVADITLGLEQDLSVLVRGLRAAGKYNYSTFFVYRKTERWTNDYYLYDAQNEVWKVQQGDQSYNSKAFEFHSTGGEGYNASQRNIYYEVKLLYDRSFGDHNIASTAVFNRSKDQRNIVEFPFFREDWVGRFTYDYASKYYAKLSGGYNGTDSFAKGKRFGFFPSAALGWNIANESFLKGNIPSLSMLKIRYSIGKTGNETGSRYLYESGWKELSSRYGYNRFGDPADPYLPRYAATKIANPDATWESSVKQNLGLDIVLLTNLSRNVLEATIEFYNERRDDIFLLRPIPSFYHPKFGTGSGEGAIGPPVINEGITKNHGVEFNTNYNITLSSGINFRIGGHFTLSESRIIDRADLPYAPEYQKQRGKPLGWMSGYQTNGYINDFETAIYSPGIKGDNSPGNYSFVDFNGNGSIEVNDQIALKGTSEPLLTYGINGGFSYRGFDLSIRLFGKHGVYYAATSLYPNFNEFLLEAKTVHLDTWSPDNTNAKFPAFRNSGTIMYESRNDRNILNASYLKIQNVSLSYLIKSRVLSEMLRIHSLKVSVSGHNLYTWTDVPFGDPEGGNGFAGGYGNYPLVRRFIFGLDMNF